MKAFGGEGVGYSSEIGQKGLNAVINNAMNAAEKKAAEQGGRCIEQYNPTDPNVAKTLLSTSKKKGEEFRAKMKNEDRKTSAHSFNIDGMNKAVEAKLQGANREKQTSQKARGGDAR